MSVLAIDIDHFKAVNDTYGHATGDEVLKVASVTMQRVFRPYDRLFRTGGEEFTAPLPDTGRAGPGLARWRNVCGAQSSALKFATSRQ